MSPTFGARVDRGIGSLLRTTVDSTSTGKDSQPKDYVTKMVTDWLKKKGYRKVTIRADGESLIVAIVERVKAARTEETILQRSPTRSSQSLGAAERAVRTVKEQFKTLRFQLEAKYGLQLLPSSPIWTWIGRHVA